MSENITRIRQGVAKVVFQDRLFRNGKNYIWIRITRAHLSTLSKYWRSKHGFYYMKMYAFNRRTRQVGQQIGYITRDKATLY